MLVALADDQVAAERLLVEAGAAVSIGWHDAIGAADFVAGRPGACGGPARVAAMSVAAAGVADGRGSERVVAEIESIVAGRMKFR